MSKVESLKASVKIYMFDQYGTVVDMHSGLANHAFDCIGAKSAGMRTAFIDRRQRPFGITRISRTSWCGRWRSSPMSWRAAAPLGEVRVLDLCRVVSGPFATMQLGDLGADVVKVFCAGDHVIA